MAASDLEAPPRAASLPRPLDCADAVLQVMPVVMDAMRGAMRQHVGEQLSVPQFRTLNFIDRRPGSSVGALAAFLGVSMPTASALVERLVRAGAVQPVTAAADRRRTELHVTEAGLVQLRRIRREVRAEFARTLGVCDGHELQTLMDGLEVLQRAFETA